MIRVAYFLLAFSTLILVVAADADADAESSASTETENETVDKCGDTSDIEALLKDPPKWADLACFDRVLVRRFLRNERLVNTATECLIDYDKCPLPGYEMLSMAIIDGVKRSGNCPECSPEQQSLVTDTIRILQRRYPKNYRRGLSFLA